MSLLEPRCMVCGAPLDKGAPFESDPRKSEVCSDRCYEIYMDDGQRKDGSGGVMYENTVRSRPCYGCAHFYKITCTGLDPGQHPMDKATRCTAFQSGCPTGGRPAVAGIYDENTGKYYPWKRKDGGE